MVHHNGPANEHQPLTFEEKLARVVGGLVVVALLVAASWWYVGVRGAILFGAWTAWWLFGVNWSRAWAFLAGGAWVPLSVLIVVSALVWSQITPSDCACLGFAVVPNFWWQLGGIGLVTAVTLFYGWLQGVMFWTPHEIELEPSGEHGHDHAHGHH